MTRLDEIVRATREEVARRATAPPNPSRRAAPLPRPGTGFAAALSGPRISLIAEHKRRSPSRGPLGHGRAVGEVVAAYERGGAAAVSVLAQETHFGGSLRDLEEARAATGLPILRKDFVVDSRQLAETAALGIDAVLLIVAILPREQLGRLYRECGDLGLEALVEVHDHPELERVLEETDARVIGINNRALVDFTVDVERTYELLAAMPEDRIIVSESGIRDRPTIERLEAAGVDAVLVGQQLMVAEDPEHAAAELAGAAAADARP